MAGGTNGRGRRHPSSGRIADGTPGQINDPPMYRPPGGSNVEPWVSTAQHCWLVTTGDEQAALLIQWRRTDDGRWQGLVVREIPGGFAATWVGAAMLKPLEPPRST